MMKGQKTIMSKTCTNYKASKYSFLCANCHGKSTDHSDMWANLKTAFKAAGVTK